MVLEIFLASKGWVTTPLGEYHELEYDPNFGYFLIFIWQRPVEETYNFGINHMDGETYYCADPYSGTSLNYPNITSHSNGDFVNSLIPRIEWDAVPGASKYKIHVWNGDRTTVIYDSLFDIGLSPETYHDIPEGILSLGTTYFLSVFAYSENYRDISYTSFYMNTTE